MHYNYVCLLKLLTSYNRCMRRAYAGRFDSQFSSEYWRVNDVILLDAFKNQQNKNRLT